MTIGSLFSGIGGLELGLEWAGLGPVKWQVEQDAFCRKVLSKHWPDATRHTDVRSVGAGALEPVDIVCGGFPCQDISLAGRRAGITGDRSCLWFEFERILRELQPRYVVIENVSALIGSGLDAVLGGLAALGYDAWWDCLRASDVGAPHRRERIFIVGWMAHAQCELDCQQYPSAMQRGWPVETEQARVGRGERKVLAYSGGRSGRQKSREIRDTKGNGPSDFSRGRGILSRSLGSSVSKMGRASYGIPEGMDLWPARPGQESYAWEPPRTAKGVKGRREKLKALGNAVVPQCAYVIGRVVCAIDDALRVAP